MLFWEGEQHVISKGVLDPSESTGIGWE
jgi:hypothetical protein